LFFCSDFLVVLLTALLFVRQGYIKLTPFSSRCLPIGSGAWDRVFFTRRGMLADRIQHVSRAALLIFLKKHRNHRIRENTDTRP